MTFFYFVDFERPERSAFVKQFPVAYGEWEVGSGSYRENIPLQDGRGDSRNDDSMVLEGYEREPGGGAPSSA